MPLGDVRESVDADQQEEPVRFLERLLQPPDGIDGVVRFCRTRVFALLPGAPASEIFRRFQQRRHEVFLLRRGQSNHGIAVRESRQRLELLVRRNVGGHEKNARKLAALRAARASARCPRWMGSKVPPKSPIFMAASVFVCRPGWQAQPSAALMPVSEVRQSAAWSLADRAVLVRSAYRPNAKKTIFRGIWNELL